MEGLNGGGDAGVTKFGAPWAPTRLPFLPTIVAVLNTLPEACLTRPGTCATLAQHGLVENAGGSEPLSL